MVKPVSIVILNYNGRDLLETGLPSVIAAAKFFGLNPQILVVDNGSTDDSVQFLHSAFPSVDVIQLDSNLGFGAGNNRGVRHTTGDIVVFLNNDMLVEKDFLAPLLEPFSDDTVFAVGSQIKSPESSGKSLETGKTFAFWDKGFMWFVHRHVTPIDYERRHVPALWASAGAAAFDKNKFLELGGFHPIYTPAYFEDTDLSYRALKRGWKILFAPHSVVYHKHRATSTKVYTPAALATLHARNQFLFLWKNIRDGRMIGMHLLTLPVRLVKYMFTGENRGIAPAVLKAMGRYCAFLFKHHAGSTQQLITDIQVFAGRAWRVENSTQRKLKILFVCPYIPRLGYHAGGVLMYNVITCLAARHEVTVFTYLESEKERQYVADLEKVCQRVVAHVRGVSLREPDWFHIKPNEVVKEFANPAMIADLHNELLFNDYDIVQYEYLQMGYLINRMKKYRAVSVLEQIEVQARKIRRGLQHAHWWEIPDYFFRWMTMLNFEVSTSAKFDAVFSLTPDDREYLYSYLPHQQYRTIPIGVDTAYFRPGEDKTEPASLVFVGNFKHTPNVDAAFYFCDSILPRIRQEIPDVRFYIVGADPPREVLALADRQNVVVTGRVDDIREYYKRATVVVAPIRLGGGMRGKIAEAWAMGKAVVATSVAAEGYDAIHGTDCFIADDPSEFAECTIRLLRDPDLRATIEQNCCTNVQEHYSWDSIVRQYEHHYYDLLAQRGGHGR